MGLRERYTHGHSGGVVEDHALRTAANSAAFLLPHLTAADVVLDIGCGPGTITLDLAEHVAEVCGIDAAATAIDRAEQEAASRATTNATFRVGDIYAIDADEASFDVVYAHQVLQHLADPKAVLAEVWRVLRPGGIIAVRDADYGTMIHDPYNPLIDRWRELYYVIARDNGGEPNAGRFLRRWVADAGFESVTSSTSTWTYATPAAVETWRRLWTSRLLDARMGRDLVRRNLATRQELEEIAAAWDRWAAAPNPFFAFLHGEVLALKPG